MPDDTRPIPDDRQLPFSLWLRTPRGLFAAFALVFSVTSLVVALIGLRYVLRERAVLNVEEVGPQEDQHYCDGPMYSQHVEKQQIIELHHGLGVRGVKIHVHPDGGVRVQFQELRSVDDNLIVVAFAKPFSGRIDVQDCPLPSPVPPCREPTCSHG